MTLQLFLELASATSNADVRQTLDEFAAEQGFIDRFALPYRYLGDRENNRGPVEAMESTENAVYEKVMNGFDAVIELKDRTRTFQGKPRSAAEAMADIGKNVNEPGVYLLTSKANTRTGTVGQPRKRANVTVVDEGTGILVGAFPTTIMSLEGSNKLSKPLMAGSYGFGGSAVYRSSEFTLIWSRSVDDPTTIGFTIVFQRFNPSARFPSYAYLVDNENQVLSFPTSDLPSKRIIRPADIDSSNVMAVNRLIPLPDSGTAVRIFELENFSAGPRVYTFLRDRGFGMPMPCRYRNSVEKTLTDDDEVDPGVDDDGPEPDARGTPKRLYDAPGLRHSLNNPAARRAYKLAFHQPPVAIMGAGGEAQATLECWVLERDSRQQTKVATSNTPVIDSVLGRERRNTACYVTLNGMTQEHLLTGNILKNAKLPYLRNHLVIEVNCDRMDATTKGRFFTSSRERLTKDSQEWVRDELTEYFRMQAEQDGELNRLNIRYRDAAIMSGARSGEEASKRAMELLARLVRSGAIGAMLSNFGGVPGEPEVAGVGTGTTTKARLEALDTGEGPNSGRGGGTAKAIVLKPIPDMLEIRKHTFKQGATEWVVVRTNAHNDWDDAVDLKLPDFLSVIARIPLRNGRVSYNVKCSDDVPLDTTGLLLAEVDRSRIGKPNLSDEAEITVISGTVTAERPVRPRTTLPQITLVAVEPNNAGWEHIHDQSLPPHKVAFDYQDEGSKVTVYWNKTFPAFTAAMEEILRRHKNPALVEKFKIDYEAHLSVLTLTFLEPSTSRSGDTTDEDVRAAHIARAQAVTANAMMLTMLAGEESVQDDEAG